MSFAEKYFHRYNSFDPFIQESPLKDLKICVVIPSYNEPDIEPTLLSLWECDRPKCSVEIIVAVNSPDNASEEALMQNIKTIETVSNFSKYHFDTKLRYFYTDTPRLKKKHAGAGWARKIGMDEALRRFDSINNPEGIIVGFDADSTCSSNYLTEIEKHFNTYPACNGASLNFEHPLCGNNFPSGYYQGITLYELHLRYLNQGLKYSKFPFAFHTVGSAFAVRAKTYMQQGGMNRRTAGEDFYFLHKITATGTFMNLFTATVYPSPRQSMRVPFGTGATMTKMIQENNFSYQTYNCNVFRLLKDFFQCIPHFYTQTEIPTIENGQILNEFLDLNNWVDSLNEIRANCASEESFLKRFYAWFNPFRVVKFLNFSHESFFQKQDVTIAAQSLIQLLRHNSPSDHAINLLEWYRQFEINNG